MATATVEYALGAPPDTAHGRLAEAMNRSGFDVKAAGLSIRARSSRSLQKNQWAADIAVHVRPAATGSTARVRVEMFGPVKTSLFEDIIAAAGDLFIKQHRYDAREFLGKIGGTAAPVANCASPAEIFKTSAVVQPTARSFRRHRCRLEVSIEAVSRA